MKVAATGNIPRLSAAEARRMLLHAQGLLDDPDAPLSPARLLSLIERMGYVQVDSINVVERAHHLTLASRRSQYRHKDLQVLHESRRALFEHWTHDASLLPVGFFGPWKRRGHRFVSSRSNRAWLMKRIGDDPDRTIADILSRIERDGPVQSRDFEHPVPGTRSGGWWGWKPHKAALEYLWWRGDLVISKRINFNKVYDLASRVYPDQHALPMPDEAAWVNWACTNAIERLGVAAAREVQLFFGGVTVEEARAWCADAARRGEIVVVEVEAEDGSKPRSAYALPDWRKRVRQANTAFARLDDRVRLLSPFDPVLRDRARAKRLFNFDYTFEAFVPGPKRKYGYYVLPVMRGEAMVGRADVKHHRDRSTLVVNGVWWEPKVKPAKALQRGFGEACERLATFIGAERVEMAPRTATPRRQAR